jgi:protein-S-isoprenylcysteine O-methyltransferase Ste14
MYGEIENTKTPRLILACNHLAAVIIVWWICFGSGIELINKTAWMEMPEGNYIRRVILLFCSIIYFLRILFTLFVLLKRKMGTGEAAGIALWLYIINITFALAGGTNIRPIGPFEFIGIMLFLAGSYLNTGSEYLRYRWKKSPQNAGKLYMQGLFKYSRHINYFGDAVLFTGFSLVTGKFITLIIPAIMLLSFIFINITMLEKYLQHKYRGDFITYKKTTKSLVPFIY